MMLGNRETAPQSVSQEGEARQELDTQDTAAETDCMLSLRTVYAALSDSACLTGRAALRRIWCDGVVVFLGRAAAELDLPL